MNRTITLRPAWTPLTIVLMVLGFIIFWPLGLAMLAYILWGDRLPELKRHFDDIFARAAPRPSAATGNSAFDAYRDAELARLEAERRRLDEELREFEAFMRDLRRARDQEEFDRFMAARRDADKGRGGRRKTRE